VRTYADTAVQLFGPGFLPDVLPKALVLTLAALVAVIAAIGFGVLIETGRSRRRRTAPWWR